MSITRTVVHQRHSQYYESVLRQAEHLFELEQKTAEALDLFDINWDQIRRGQYWASQAAKGNEAALILVSDYAAAGSTLLSFRQGRQETIAWLEQALEAARHFEQWEVAQIHLNQLGLAYEALADYEKAVCYFKEGLALGDTFQGDKEQENLIIGNLGMTYLGLGQIAEAIECMETALPSIRRWEDHRSEGRIENHLGIAYKALGDYDKALEHYTRALAKAEEAKDILTRGQSLNNLGIIQRRLKQYDVAQSHLKQALEISRLLGDTQLESEAISNMATLYLETGDAKRALQEYVQALELCRRNGDLQGETIILGDMGLAYEALGKLDKAHEHFEHALKLSESIADLGSQASDLGNLGNLEFRQGNYAQAVSYHERALAINTTIGDVLSKGESMVHLAIAYVGIGRLDKAFKYLSDAHDLFVGLQFMEKVEWVKQVIRDIKAIEALMSS